MKTGDRVIQIPRDGWPAREGTVARVDGRFFDIAWDDGRTDRLHESQMVPLDVWLVKPEHQQENA